ncbi:Transposase [Candidatus Regiella insecticola 5.15]|uniref:Transposase n=1 Tax=Candidatus Regiella insecticola 5.15 TaxID=1005043 RepID=G2H0C3_9ENTR|nr:Transposase [Candidatus Regiella insecticola 5.15]
MKKKHKLPYGAEFKREANQLVTKQGYSVTEAAKAMGVSKNGMRLWVNQLRGELQGKSPLGSSITQEQQKIRELEKKIRRIEEENTILKKASVIEMSDFLNNSR